MADGTLTIGEGFYNHYAQFLRWKFPQSDWAQATADEAERLSGEFDQLRAAYAQVYKVNESVANSFTGQLLTGAGQFVPQTAAALLPFAGIVALQSQNFQYAWEDAERAAKESGRPFDPDRAFAYAETVAFTSAVLDRLQVGKGVKPWVKGGKAPTIRKGLMKVFRSAVAGGGISTVQGAATDAAATGWGVEKRNPFDPERRGTDFVVGGALTGGLSTVSGGLKVFTPKGVEHVVPVVRGTPTLKKLSDARRWLKENLAGKPIEVPALDGTITVSRSTAEKMTSASAVMKSSTTEAHIAALEAIPELAQNAIVETHADRSNDPNIKAIHRLYAPMMVNGKIHRVKMTVKEIVNPAPAKRLYSLEAVEIEVPAWSSADAELERANESQGSASTPHAGFIKVTDLLGKSTVVSKSEKDKGRVSYVSNRRLKEMFPAISADSMVHFSTFESNESIKRTGVIPNAQGYSHWFRFGDIQNLLPEQIPALIGNLANDDVKFINIASVDDVAQHFSKFGDIPGTNSAIIDYEAKNVIPVTTHALFEKY